MPRASRRSSARTDGRSCSRRTPRTSFRRTATGRWTSSSTDVVDRTDQACERRPVRRVGESQRSVLDRCPGTRRRVPLVRPEPRLWRLERKGRRVRLRPCAAVSRNASTSPPPAPRPCGHVPRGGQRRRAVRRLPLAGRAISSRETRTTPSTCSSTIAGPARRRGSASRPTAKQADAHGFDRLHAPKPLRVASVPLGGRPLRGVHVPRVQPRPRRPERRVRRVRPRPPHRSDGPGQRLGRRRGGQRRELRLRDQRRRQRRRVHVARRQPRRRRHERTAGRVRRAASPPATSPVAQALTAAGVGFEPTGRLHVQQLSRLPRSTAPAPRRSAL